MAVAQQLHEFVVGLSVLLFQLVLLDGERRLQLEHLLLSLPDILQTQVDMELLLLQVTPLLMVQLEERKMVKQSELSMSWSIREMRTCCPQYASPHGSEPGSGWVHNWQHP